jgi:hypothetical protein
MSVEYSEWGTQPLAKMSKEIDGIREVSNPENRAWNTRNERL